MHRLDQVDIALCEGVAGQIVRVAMIVRSQVNDHQVSGFVGVKIPPLRV